MSPKSFISGREALSRPPSAAPASTRTPPGSSRSLPERRQDDAGRLFANPGTSPLAVATDAFPPLAKFSAPFGIIELSDPVLPVTLRNLEAQVRTRKLEVDENGKDTIDQIKEGSLAKRTRIG